MGLKSEIDRVIETSDGNRDSGEYKLAMNEIAGVNCERFLQISNVRIHPLLPLVGILHRNSKEDTSQLLIYDVSADLSRPKHVFDFEEIMVDFQFPNCSSNAPDDFSQISLSLLSAKGQIYFVFPCLLHGSTITLGMLEKIKENLGEGNSKETQLLESLKKVIERPNSIKGMPKSEIVPLRSWTIDSETVSKLSQNGLYSLSSHTFKPFDAPIGFTGKPISFERLPFVQSVCFLVNYENEKSKMVSSVFVNPLGLFSLTKTQSRFIEVAKYQVEKQEELSEGPENDQKNSKKSKKPGRFSVKGLFGDPEPKTKEPNPKNQQNESMKMLDVYRRLSRPIVRSPNELNEPSCLIFLKFMTHLFKIDYSWLLHEESKGDLSLNGSSNPKTEVEESFHLVLEAKKLDGSMMLPQETSKGKFQIKEKWWSFSQCLLRDFLPFQNGSQSFIFSEKWSDEDLAASRTIGTCITTLSSIEKQKFIKEVAEFKPKEILKKRKPDNKDWVSIKQRISKKMEELAQWKHFNVNFCSKQEKIKQKDLEEALNVSIHINSLSFVASSK